MTIQARPAQTIPTLDLQDFTSGKNPNAFVQAFGQALSEFGFFTLVNHGVEQRIIDAAYGAALLANRSLSSASVEMRRVASSGKSSRGLKSKSNH